jgi:Fur family ferric uptake transcriptional regulator
METPTAYIDSLRPAGGKRSGKRDVIVNVFLRQEGHLSADDLVDLIRREDQKISRATVYRTLQWMVDAGIARKVDFGEGRFRFEHSYRHPRHFHLICKSCNQSSEFLSSDIEALLEEVAAARNFTARQSVLQIYGTCDACRTGRRSDLGKLETRYRQLLAQDPQLDSRPTFLFFKGAANGLFAAGTDQLAKGGVDDKQALMIGIRCERGSHKFFKRYGERFEDSEGKQIFLEFADEERQHLDLLIREYRALSLRQHKSRGRRRQTRARASV